MSDEKLCSKIAAIPTDNLARWEGYWERNELRWHVDAINPLLIKYFDQLIDSKDSEERTVLVPLCGKTKDIGYIASKGHKVFGVEGVRRAVVELDVENEFGFNFDSERSIFKTKNGKIRVYLGDFFTFPVTKFGTFDLAYDFGSLTAIDYALRNQYAEKMKEIVTNEEGKFRYLLRVLNYDLEKKLNEAGPRSVTPSDMEVLFGSWSSIRLLERIPLPKSSIVRKTSVEGAECFEDIYLLTNK